MRSRTRALLAGTALALSAVSVWLLRRAPAAHVAPPDDKPWETLAETERVLPPAQYEARDVRLLPFVLGGVGTVAAVLGSLGLALWLYPNAAPDKQIRQPLPRFPDPVLQPDPPADMGDMRAEQLGRLQNAYWLDRARGTVHMPIADAMQDVARRGIPDWPTRPVSAR